VRYRADRQREEPRSAAGADGGRRPRARRADGAAGSCMRL